MKLDYVNQTVIEEYLQCPHLFKMRKLGFKHAPKKKVGEFSPQKGWGDVTTIGKAIHSVLPVYVEKGKNSALRLLATKVGTAKQWDEAKAIFETIADEIKVVSGMKAEEKLEFITRGLPMCEASVDFIIRRKDWVRVIELKTGWKMKGKVEIEKDIEARWYMFMLNNLFPDVEKKLSYFYARHNTWVDVDPDPLDLFYVGELCSNIEQDTQFLPNRSYCPVCPFITHCKIGIGGSTPADIFGQYLHYKAKTDAYLNLLKETAEGSEIRMGDWVAYWAKVKKREIVDLREFLEFLDGNGVMVKPDMSELKKKYPALLPDAVELGFLKESDYTKFTVVRV